MQMMLPEEVNEVEAEGVISVDDGGDYNGHGVGQS